MKASKIIRIVIASILSFCFIYFTLILRGKIDPDLNHFIYNLIIWGGFLCFSALLISYYSPEIYGENKKMIDKNRSSPRRNRREENLKHSGLMI